MPKKAKRKYKSDAFEAIHSAVAGMYKAGTIDKATMRTFDKSCLTVPDSIAPAEIKLNSRKPVQVDSRFLPAI